MPERADHTDLCQKLCPLKPGTNTPETCLVLTQAKGYIKEEGIKPNYRIPAYMDQKFSDLITFSNYCLHPETYAKYLRRIYAGQMPGSLKEILSLQLKK